MDKQIKSRLALGSLVQTGIHLALRYFAFASVLLFAGAPAKNWAGPLSLLQERVDSSKAGPDVRVLEPGKPVERELKKGEAHNYRINLAAGQYLRVIVKQQGGIYVVMTLYGPEEKRLAEATNLYGDKKPESLEAVAEESGIHRLAIHSHETALSDGRYEIKLQALRKATNRDGNRALAAKAEMQANDLAEQPTAESYQRALEKYDEAAKLWRIVNDIQKEGLCFESMASINAYLGEYRKALTLYDQALSLSQAVADTIQMMGLLRSIGAVYSQLDEYQKALDYYHQALPLIRARDERILEAETLNMIGMIYADRRENQKALDYHEKALAASRAIAYDWGEAYALTSIGFVYTQWGELTKALEQLEQALHLWRKIGDRRSEANVLSEIGFVNDFLGESQKSLDCYRQALQINKILGNRYGQSTNLNNMGWLYYDFGEKQPALDYFVQALDLRKAMDDRNGQAQTLSSIGRIYADENENQKALEHFNQALELARAVGNHNSEAIALNNIGGVYANMNEWQKALGYYNEALPIRRAIEDPFGEGYTLNGIGKVYANLGETQKALEHYQQALTLSRTVGDRKSEAAVLFNIARAENARGDSAQAQAHIEAALNVVESLRTKVASHELRASFLASMQKGYELYINVLMGLHQNNPSKGHDFAALQANERARARSLLEMLTEARLDIRQGVDPALLERERALQQRLDAQERARMQLHKEKHTQEQIEKAEQDLSSLLAQYQEIQAEIRATNPRYAALTQPQPLSAKEIQQLLDHDTVLLEYALGEERSFLWAVTPATISSFELPKREAVESAARQVYDLLTARNQRPGNEAGEEKSKRIAKAEAEYLQAAAQLSRMILGPGTEQLGKKRLVIVCDGALQYVPFGALPGPVISNQSSVINNQKKLKTDHWSLITDYRPLITDHEIVSLPSASVLGILRRELANRQRPEGMIAALADPVFSADDPRVKLASRLAADSTAGQPAVAKLDEQSLTRSIREVGATSSGFEMPRLKFSREEAQAILALAPSEKRLSAMDFQASYAIATSAAMRQFRIIHFATHSLLNSMHPELSGIVLSLVDEQGRPQNGFLRLHEIYNLNLSADLVVLSACQTALGKEIRGEGLVGLTRGFMYAGAPRVVASLWKVDDQATAELMRHFYKALFGERQLPPAAALRAAQTALCKTVRWKSPYYWAAFVMQGDWQ